MEKIVSRLASTFYKPFLAKYLSKTRNYRYKNILLRIPPEVFHPGFFFSTKLLIHNIKNLELENKTFLELGSGSGLISIYAARKNARVTAIDINPVAVEHLKINGIKNDVELQIILSDMFNNVPKQTFDFIIINPPYYKKDPSTYKDYAWYCGENGEYFQSLFGSIADYMNAESTVLIILSEHCDLEMIKSIAGKSNFNLRLVYEKKNIMEKNFIYKIERSQLLT